MLIDFTDHSRISTSLLPFITDEINHQIQSILGKTTTTLTHCPYPASRIGPAIVIHSMPLIILNRLSPPFGLCARNSSFLPKLINIIVEASNSPIQDTLFKHQDLLKHLTKIDVITLENTDTTLPACASCISMMLRYIFPWLDLLILTLNAHA